ncbi:MAG: beta-galactosidase [Spirochaetales bacterium]|nr:beta-galactosidase [Spirochaetales bacterium]
MKKKLLFISLSLLFFQGFANIEVDLNISEPVIKENLFKMGNPGEGERSLKTNNQYMTLGGVPFIPVMGEMHFSRVREDQWKERLLLMKASGVNIVATYVFWNHHEEVEGFFDFEGQKDLQAFLQLCKELDLYVWLRLGPWCHGEARRGGFPDWLEAKHGIATRSMNSVFIKYVDILYEKIIAQCVGFNWSEGGPIIGAQFENEFYVGSKSAAEYVLYLKKKAISCGLDLPFYSITLWPVGPRIPLHEFLLLGGGYPGSPWSGHTNPINRSENYIFSAERVDTAVGADLLGKLEDGSAGSDAQVYPWYTCELGVANQISWHRRPVFNGLDGIALVFSKIGSGCNLPGYYMYTGGLNPTGVLTTLEENKATKYPNDYPIVTYDFQTAIQEYGQTGPSYPYLRRFHYFLNDFGYILAPSVAITPGIGENGLNFSIRKNKETAFVFINQYNRYDSYKNFPQVDNLAFTMKSGEKSIVFPAKPASVAKGSLHIWPFNLDLAGVRLDWATATPVKFVKERGVVFFYGNSQSGSEFAFGKDAEISALANCSVDASGENLLVTVADSASDAAFTVKQGTKTLRFEVLTEANSLKFASDSANSVLSGDTIFFDKNSFVVRSLSNTVEYSKYDYSSKKFVKAQESLPRVELGASYEQISCPDSRAEVIVVPAKSGISVPFEIGGQSKVKDAKLYLSSSRRVSVKVNGRLALPRLLGKVYVYDLSKKVKLGGNSLSINSRSAAEVAFELRVTTCNELGVVLLSNSSMAEVSVADLARVSLPGQYRVQLDEAAMERLERSGRVWLSVDFFGDQIRAEAGGSLLVDQYFHKKGWNIELSHFREQILANNGIIDLKIKPLSAFDKIYFETTPQFGAGLVSVGVNLEYEYVFK